MTRRDWWLAVTMLALAITLHALFPRYEWRDPGGEGQTYLRFDRWTGRSQSGEFTHVWGKPAGAWVSHEEIRQSISEGNGMAGPTWAIEHIAKEYRAVDRADQFNRAERERERKARTEREERGFEELLAEAARIVATGAAGNPATTTTNILKEVDKVLADQKPPTTRSMQQKDPPK